MKNKVYILIILLLITTVLVSCTKKTYIVTFHTYSDDVFSQVKYQKEIDYNQTHRPGKLDHEFQGWYLEASLDTSYKPDTYENKNLDLHAKWEETKGKVMPDMIDLYEKAYEKHKQAEFSYYIADGKTETNAPVIGKIVQTIYSIKHINRQQVYQYTASVGNIDFMDTKMFFETYGNHESVEVIKGKLKSKLEIKEQESPQSYTKHDYLENHGVYPNELNYIVNKNTVQRAFGYTYTNNIHEFKLSLDLEKSVPNYIKNIKATNQYESEDAVFSKILLIVKIDDQGYFKEIKYEENYQVRVNAPIIGWQTQSMVASITETFTYHQDIKINRITEHNK